MLSRVADSLYWLGRYLERGEHSARVTGVYIDIVLDQTTSVEDERYQQFLKILQIEDDETTGQARVANLINTHILDPSNPSSVMASVDQARENARQIREQISSETWVQINQLYLMMKKPPRNLKRQPQVFMQEIMRHFHLISGISDSTMTHDEGWQFMRLGNYMERSLSLIHLIDTHFDFHADKPPSPEDYLDWVAVLRSCTAFEAYCNVYTADLQPGRIAEFLLLNAEFPHSLQFSVSMMNEALTKISDITKSRRNQHLNRRAGRLKSTLQFSQIDEIMDDGLHAFLETVQKQCNQIHETIYQVYISFPVAEELPL